MTLFLDSSALVKRYNPESGTDFVIAAMTNDGAWAASWLAYPESRRAICREDTDPAVREQRDLRFRTEWASIDRVPIDIALLERAGEISCQHATRTLDAIHLAAAERLPLGLIFMTFDERQAAAARALGFAVAP